MAFQIIVSVFLHRQHIYGDGIDQDLQNQIYFGKLSIWNTLFWPETEASPHKQTPKSQESSSSPGCENIFFFTNRQNCFRKNIFLKLNFIVNVTFVAFIWLDWSIVKGRERGEWHRAKRIEPGPLQRTVEPQYMGASRRVFLCVIGLQWFPFFFAQF